MQKPFQGLATFLKTPVGEQSRAVGVYGVPFDTATSFRPGARFAPNAIRQASMMLTDGHHPEYETDPATYATDLGDIIVPTDPVRAVSTIGDTVAACPFAVARKPLLFMGGDHTVTLGLIEGLGRARGDLADLVVVHFDAHCDTWQDHFGEPIGHGTWVRNVVERGLVKAQNIIQIGIRSPVDPATRKWLPKRGGKVVSAREAMHLDLKDDLPDPQRLREFVEGLCLLRHRLPRPRLCPRHRDARDGRPDLAGSATCARRAAPYRHCRHGRRRGEPELRPGGDYRSGGSHAAVDHGEHAQPCLNNSVTTPFSRISSCMLRIAFISDLHLNFYEKGMGPVPSDRHHLFGAISLPKTLDADVLVLAGDIHPAQYIRDRVVADLEAHYGIPVILVEGNHDYEGEDFPLGRQGRIHVVNGKVIATATLWTRLTPIDAIGATTFYDFKAIRGLTPDQWNEQHEADVDFLRKARADIIVTHHAPTPLSIHPRFGTSSQNCFFASNLDMSQFGPCKLWIHGHVHDDFDYEVDGIHVVCNPLGYPFERRSTDIRYVEVA